MYWRGQPVWSITPIMAAGGRHWVLVLLKTCMQSQKFLLAVIIEHVCTY